MTPEERVAKIVGICAVPSNRTIDLVADEIRAAVEEENKRVIEWVLSQEYIREAKAEAYEDARQWVAAEARDCGCSERIEKHIRAAMREATKESER